MEKPSIRLSVASTFTCDPIKDTFRFWCEKFGLQDNVHFSPYDQVFQELLHQDSSLNHADNDARLVFVKTDDWLRNLSDSDTVSAASHIKDNIDSLGKYAATAASYSKSPLFIVFTRNSPDAVIKPEDQAAHEQYISDYLSDQSNVFVIQSGEADEKYPVADFYDAQRNDLGHIPYKPEYFAALATLAFRKLLASKRKPYKVIVLDCDYTLWGGVCGEVGPGGIELTEPYTYLQSFMLEQLKSGKLLCLCSKNVPEDVEKVFAERSDMIIGEKDIVGSKINWRHKSQNIKELAEELNLGLDSFIFVDDNPLECAEVRANCPEVLTFNLPAKPDEIIGFLNHAWPFDFLKSTSEDQQRTKLYKDNIRRASYKNSSSSLKEFIEGLNLDIRITDATPEDMDRVSQLTYRTNQFNFTTIRRSEEEIKELLDTYGFSCKICRVKDRFGDYGLVGVMLYQSLSDRVVLDSFMLSCRVLGRGVEHEMLKSVGHSALAKGVDNVQINFQQTEKNQPAFNFLKSVFDDFTLPENGYMTTSEFLGKLSYSPAKSDSAGNTGAEQTEKSAPAASVDQNSMIFEKIAHELNSASGIAELLRSNGHAPGNNGTKAAAGAGKTAVQTITDIWENVLGETGIRADQHFFDVGGTSLKAVEVLSQLNERFNKELTIVSLFEHSTISSLASLVEDAPAENAKLRKVMERAAMRRDRLRRNG